MYGVILSRSFERNARYQAILNYTEMYQHREKGTWLSIPSFIYPDSPLMIHNYRYF